MTAACAWRQRGCFHGMLELAEEGALQEQPVPAMSQPPQKGWGLRSQLAASEPLATPPTLCALRMRRRPPSSQKGHSSSGGSESRCRASETRPQDPQRYS